MEEEPRRKQGRPAKRGRLRKVEELDDNKYGVTTHNDHGPTFPPDLKVTNISHKDVRPNPLQLDFDVTTLGTRTETHMVEKAVVVGRTDLGKDIITMKMLPETVTKLQPILNLEEALSLGRRDWKPFPPKQGHWFCHVEQKGQRRRFLIPEDVYQKVKDA